MQTCIDPKAKRARYHFESLYELGAWIKRTPKTWRLASSGDEVHVPEQEWDLKAGYAGAVDMALKGWNEGAERVQEALKAFPLQTPAPDTRTDVYGFRPHVPRFCAGAPDSMIRHAPVAETGAGKVLTLVIPIIAPWYVSAEHMANFGVAVAQYVNQMEMNGTRVEVIAAMANAWDLTGKTVNGTVQPTESAWRVSQTWTVKNADQPLDLAVVAFAIGHPAMYRRLGFALLERCAAPEHSEYGFPVHAREGDLINAPVGCVVLNGMREADKYATTPEKGFEYVSKQIETAIEAQEL